MAKMGSHTARFGAISALWYEATGEIAARDRAARSLNWATYMCDDRGVVAVGEDHNEGWWFTDGYGDYIRHFLVAMSAVPEWAPPGEVHVLRSTSIVTHVTYAPARAQWSTFDGGSTETLRVPAPPMAVTAAGAPIAKGSPAEGDGYSVRPLPGGDFVLTVRHASAGPIVVAIGAKGADDDSGHGDAGRPVPARTAGGCAVRSAGCRGGSSAAAGSCIALAFALRRYHRRRARTP
jgi:hypothetical protein